VGRGREAATTHGSKGNPRRRSRQREGPGAKEGPRRKRASATGVNGQRVAPEREAHESHGRSAVGNGSVTQRTLAWSKASRPAGGSLHGEGAAVGGDAGTATQEGNALEGEASEGTLQTDPPGNGGARRGPKPDEPHGRLQDATSLWSDRSHKPSRWGGTTRTDPAHARKACAEAPRKGRQAGERRTRCRRRGDLCTTLRGARRTAGQRDGRSVSESEARGQDSGPRTLRRPRCASRTSSQAHDPNARAPTQGEHGGDPRCRAGQGVKRQRTQP
jgi:hypothetical protein